MGKAKIISILSGKGGSGKTVTSLSLSMLLSKINKKVLLVDCDTSTHGSTYFFDNSMYTIKNGYITSLQNIVNREVDKFEPILYDDRFHFIPSSNDTQSEKYSKPEELKYFLEDISDSYDVIILDCQAGFSEFTKIAASIADLNLIILEADAISTSAIRVLYLKLGNVLNNKNTFQIFNKLSDEERKIYDKIIGGTIFPNLPAIPFDWTVRASFSLGEIPNIETRDSAFGLGIIRMSKILFKEYKNELVVLEKKLVGDWYNDVIRNIKELEHEKRRMNEELSHKKRLIYRNQMATIAFFLSLISILIVLKNIFKYEFLEQINIEIITGVVGVIASALIFYRANYQVSVEKEQDKRQIMTRELETEIERYKTLIETDPRIREHIYDNESTAHNNVYKK